MQNATGNEDDIVTILNPEKPVATSALGNAGDLLTSRRNIHRQTAVWHET
jgi:hypothetical protein